MRKKSRKEDLKNLLLKESVGSYGRIYQLIQTGKLDKIIDKITDEKTDTKVSSIVEKGYLTGNEQFLDILSNFISFFDRSFPPIAYKDYLLESIFENKDIPEFLLSKKYWGDNDNITYFTYHIKRYIVSNFRDILYQTKSELNSSIWNYFGDKLNIDLNDEKAVDRLFSKMQELCWTNVNCYSIIYMFGNWSILFTKIGNTMKRKDKSLIEAVKIVNDNFVTHIEIIYDNYLKNKKLLKYVKNM